MQTNSFTSIVHSTIANTAIMDLLESNEAVVLERIAMGAGATNWYYCKNRPQLNAVEGKLSPGSVVSFYFDGRIRNTLYTPALKATLESILANEGDIVIGLIHDNPIQIDVEFVDNPLQLAEILGTLDAAVRIFYGAFPGRDNDGIKAVTIVLPDADGVVRPHPH